MTIKLTLEQKIGQVMMVGFDGLETTDTIRSMIRDYHVGSVITFPRNIQTRNQVRTMIEQLQQYVKDFGQIYPLLVATDQENGRVAHRIGLDAPRFPGSMALGATFSADNAFSVAKGLALEMRKIGFNMVLSPSLDINSNPENPIIGGRSFGETAEHVAAMGSAYIRGLHAGGLGSAAKHFPGHGDTDTDSHLALPVIHHPLEKLREFELVPFQAAVANDVDMVMTSHIYFSAIEENGIPATLSGKILQDVLRGELGFEGVIITDCLEMHAISKGIGSAEGAVRAFLAGADLLIVSHTYEVQVEVYQRMLQAVISGEIAESRLNRSVERILALKEKLARLRQASDDKRALPNLEKEEKEHIEMARDAMAKGITMVRDTNLIIPLQLKPQERLLLVNALTAWQSDAGFEERGAVIFKDELAKYHANVTELGLEPGGLPEDLPDFSIVDNASAVIIMTGNASMYPDQAHTVKDILNRNANAIVIAFKNPYDLTVFQSAGTYIAAYEPSQLAAQVVADILFGKKKAEGKLPVSIPGLYKMGERG